MVSWLNLNLPNLLVLFTFWHQAFWHFHKWLRRKKKEHGEHFRILVCYFFNAIWNRSSCRSRWENLDIGQCWRGFSSHISLHRFVSVRFGSVRFGSSIQKNNLLQTNLYCKWLCNRWHNLTLISKLWGETKNINAELNRQYRFQPIKFVNSVVPSPCETEPYIKPW